MFSSQIEEVLSEDRGISVLPKATDIAIQVTNLSKCYQIYDQPHHRLLQMFARSKKKYFRDFWALKSVSFEVRKGETVGIVGRNGSGKSTLLQLICGTLNCTSGDIKTNGRIAALLELGSGFNPEFTGRENVYMNAAILGLSREETARRYDGITTFADIGDFINQPVKSYSSGMVVRLAFAVAIHVDPQVLVIDEALAVGDEAFQRKCYARIQKMRENGVTVLFVSHSANSIIELCDWALLMDQGEVIYSDAPKKVIATYQRLAFAPPEKVSAIRTEIKSRANFNGNEELIEISTHDVRKQQGPSVVSAYFDPSLIPQSTVEYESLACVIRDAKVLDDQGKRVNVLSPRSTYLYTYSVEFTRTVGLVRLGMMIKTTTGVELAGVISHPEGEGIERIMVGTKMQASFRFSANLNPGIYFINAGVVGSVDGGDEQYLHRILDAVMIRMPPIKCLSTSGYVDLSIAGEPSVQWQIS